MHNQNSLQERPAPASNCNTRLDPSSARLVASFPDDSNDYGYAYDYGCSTNNSSSSSSGITSSLEYVYPPIPPPPSILDPMSPERKARKQRLRPTRSTTRRGGACHSDLLKSAVLATLESYESSDDEDEENDCFKATRGRRRSSMASCSEQSLLLSDSNNNRRSSRKRARQHWNDGASTAAATVDDLLDTDRSSSCGILPADDGLLVGAMDVCTISSRNSFSVPVTPPSTTTTTTITTSKRHVARRTSTELARGLVPSPRTNGNRGREMQHV